MSWTVTVVAEDRAVVAARNDAVFSDDRVRHRQPDGRRYPCGGRRSPRPPRRRRPTPGDVVSQLARFTVRGSTGGYIGSSDFLKLLADAEAGVKPTGLFEGRGPLAILALVFLGGLALNLTPCVLPMIPINLAIIGAGTQAGRRSRGLLLGAAYGAAMALVYGVSASSSSSPPARSARSTRRPGSTSASPCSSCSSAWRCSTS